MNIEIGNKKIEFEIKDLAERANSNVMLRSGDSQVFITAVMSEQDVENLGFFPLTVNYEEKYYAAGKILGSRYIRREGRPSDNATLISRLIDRAIRPLFNDGLKRAVQVIATSLSWDQENDPDVLGLLGASLALTISDIPWQGPIGAVRIGIKNEKIIINPTYEEREHSSLDIIFSGIKKNGEILINMIEASAEQTPEDLILKALEKALPEIKKLIDFQEKIQSELGKQKILIENKMDPELEIEVKKFLGNKIEKILFGREPSSAKASEGKQGIEKRKKLNELKTETIELITEDYPAKHTTVKNLFEKQVKKIVQEKAVQQEKRVDGRKLNEIRKLSCEVGLIPRTHGSGLFCRGLTKSLSILTLGGPREQQLIEGMEIAGKKRFLHHYNFPPYSTGEVKFLRSPGRREIGHGMLAEKALFPIIPDFDDFPYTIRIVSEMLCSNGSTSMASVCSSCLALMDAGVPIKIPVAGIAIGLMASNNGKDYKLLTDIQGPEDFYGHMDFKVAGTKQGITVLQMDVKTAGITNQIFKKALEKAKKARMEILNNMAELLPEPRKELSEFAPRIYKLTIPCEKIGEVIGPKGQTIKRITEQTGAEINIEDDGVVYITSQDKESAQQAMNIIKNMTREIKAGEKFLGKVKNITNFGAFLELTPGKDGLLHNTKIKKPLRVGEEIPVKVVAIDQQGRINLDLADSSTASSKKYGGRKKYKS